MPRLLLTSIVCEVPEESDKDEIYLMCQGHKIWPSDKKFVKIDCDEEIKFSIPLEISENGWVEIELWDYDLTTKNDHLGTFHLQTNNGSQQSTEILTRNNEEAKIAEYYLNWETVE